MRLAFGVPLRQNSSTLRPSVCSAARHKATLSVKHMRGEGASRGMPLHAEHVRQYERKLNARSRARTPCFERAAAVLLALSGGRAQMHHFNVRRDGRQRRGCVGETLKAVRTRSIDDRSPMPQPPGPHRPRREPLESRECANTVQRFSAAEASRVVRPGGVCRSSPSVRSGMGARPRCADRGPGTRPAGRAVPRP